MGQELPYAPGKSGAIHLSVSFPVYGRLVPDANMQEHYNRPYNSISIDACRYFNVTGINGSNLKVLIVSAY